MNNYETFIFTFLHSVSLYTILIPAIVDPCNSNTLSLNNSYIVNPGYPGDASTAASCTGSGVVRSGRQATTSATYSWNLTKATSDVSCTILYVLI